MIPKILLAILMMMYVFQSITHYEFNFFFFFNENFTPVKGKSCYVLHVFLLGEFKWELFVHGQKKGII